MICLGWLISIGGLPFSEKWSKSGGGAEERCGEGLGGQEGGETRSGCKREKKFYIENWKELEQSSATDRATLLQGLEDLWKLEGQHGHNFEGIHSFSSVETNIKHLSQCNTCLSFHSEVRVSLM